MELRNRRLSGEQGEGEEQQAATEQEEEKVEETELHKEGTLADSSDELMESEELDDVSGGFLGDFEEIDEDEDVERFISQNHTPSASTRQSPSGLRPQRAEEMSVASDGESSDDEDDSFESIAEPEAGSLASTHKEAESATAPQVVLQKGGVARKAQSSEEPGVGISVEQLERLRALQDGFREKIAAKLADDQLFFSAEVYKKYTILTGGAASIAEAGVPAAAKSAAAAPAVQQKRSSLRSGNERTGGGDQAGAAARAKYVRSGEDGDDVVGAILDVMGPAKASSGGSTGRVQVQDMASDMLVAMMAIEGVSSNEVGKQAAAGRHEGAEDKAAREPAVRLAKGYAGPFSQLTVAEHRRFTELAQRVKGGGALGSGRDSADYQRLKAQVESEQQLFRTQGREKALPLLRHISEAVRSSAVGELGRVGEEALRRYPHAYVPVRVAAIKPSASGYVPLEYRETLLQRGACYYVAAPEGEQSLEAPEGEQSLEAPEGGQGLQGPEGMEAEVPAAVSHSEAPMSHDAVGLELAERARADVAISASALVALLTLPQSFTQDAIIPFRVVEAAGSAAGGAARRVVVVDRALLPTHGATPRKLSQMHYEAAVRRRLADRSRRLELGEGEGGGEGNANYTLWGLGGLRLLVRYAVHGFTAPRDGDGAAPTTVTVETKLEYHLRAATPTAAMAAAGADAYEETPERERLAWWLGCYLRGSPSEVWVAHVDAATAAICRVARRTCADLSGAPHAQPPPTAGVLALLNDLLRLPAAQYMLVHRRRTWDATIYRALDAADAPAAAAALSLPAELGPPPPAAPTQLDVEADYVPPAWCAAPPQIPYTYAPADLAPARPAAASASARKRRRAVTKAKAKRAGG
ncbi:hypothetical protein H4R26_002067 [Coemansia thaxteri]|uniref:Little elongation complex subunit 2 C-terminal domain-containing protein n=1 Tax=Coemansia thaxteri TaxID=2663907 RepID=A0A9W8EKI0_9FUNG|nr:hypothetical protein H4R26_002067 [Coemansia thaxteri]KAJ2485249.1 hypothetical protein EV174_001854 [Coemansia sp. RSA 2320]